MAQPARRRRTQPSMSPPPSEPPDPPVPPVPPEPEVETREMVTCFLSGARIPKERAVLARLGPGKVMWMSKELTNQG